jgi:hypothetical protein
MRISNINNFKQSLKYLYHNLIPEALKVRLSTLLDPLPGNRLRASAKIRTENYYQACIKESKKESYDGSKNNHYLHEAFKKHLVRSNLIDEKWWFDFITLINLPEGSKFHNINQSLINRIDNSNFDSLEYFEVLDIYALCLRYCLFELGYYLRKKSLKIALRYSTSLKKNENWKFKAKLSALLENSNFLEFDQLFTLFESRNNQEKYLFSYLRDIFEGKKYPLFVNSDSDKETEKDKKFRKFVENKKIVIVGPSPTDKKDGYEIDRADIVIRTNHVIGDPIIKGSRCDISYFNFETTQHMSEYGFLKWPSNISWVVARVLEQVVSIFKRLSSDGVDIKNLSGRSLERVDKVLFYGSLTALQNIIFDLSRYNPKEIFLYHFDVMLTKERIKGYYPEINKDKEFHLKMIKCFPEHDPVTNFLVTKSFWKQGFLKGDYRFEEVMKMNTKDYMKNMQKMYHLDNSFEIN